MHHARILSIGGLCLIAVLVGCPRSKLPPSADPKVSFESSDYPPPPPWRVPNDSRARLGLAGLPGVTDAHHASYHIHAGLRIFYQGQAVTVPAGIGLDRYGDPVSPVHTHRASGVVHVEYPEPRVFTWGQFFALWGVPIGRATVYADGTRVDDPLDLPIADQQQVVVVFGAPPSIPIAWPTHAPSEEPEDASPTTMPAATPTPDAQATANP